MLRNIRRQQVEDRKKKKQLILLTIGILIFIYLSFTLIFGENGLLRYLKLRSTKNDLVVQIEKIKRQNEEMRREIEALKKDPNLLEELARQQGLMKEGELIFKYYEEDQNF